MQEHEIYLKLAEINLLGTILETLQKIPDDTKNPVLTIDFGLKYEEPIVENNEIIIEEVYFDEYNIQMFSLAKEAKKAISQELLSISEKLLTPENHSYIDPEYDYNKHLNLMANKPKRLFKEIKLNGFELYKRELGISA